VIKPAAAEERLHRTRWPAVVFENYDDMAAADRRPGASTSTRTR
jgi:hypothetical protein